MGSRASIIKLMLFCSFNVIFIVLNPRIILIRILGWVSCLTDLKVGSGRVRAPVSVSCLNYLLKTS